MVKLVKRAPRQLFTSEFYKIFESSNFLEQPLTVQVNSRDSNFWYLFKNSKKSSRTMAKRFLQCNYCQLVDSDLFLTRSKLWTLNYIRNNSKSSHSKMFKTTTTLNFGKVHRGNYFAGFMFRFVTSLKRTLPQMLYLNFCGTSRTTALWNCI